MKTVSKPAFTQLIRDAHLKRGSLQGVCDAYRVVNGSEDGLEGVTLDRFGTHYQLQFFDRTWFWCETEICAAVRQACSPQFLVVKERLDPSGKSLEKPHMRVVIGEPAQSACEVREGAAYFQVDLLDTVNPGLFLDMRENRLAVAPLAQGGEMLNLFCYTGSFSVHARLAGATRAVNVDVSGKILDRVRTNYERNGIEVQKGEFFKGDSTEYLEYCVRKNLQFQTVVLDPPSFSRSERGVFQAKAHLGKLVSLCAQCTLPGGHILVATNLSEFHPRTLGKPAQEWVNEAGQSSTVVWARGQGADFPGSGKVKESCLSAVLLKLV